MKLSDGLNRLATWLDDAMLNADLRVSNAQFFLWSTAAMLLAIIVWLETCGGT